MSNDVEKCIDKADDIVPVPPLDSMGMYSSLLISKWSTVLDCLLRLECLDKSLDPDLTDFDRSIAFIFEHGRYDINSSLWKGKKHIVQVSSSKSIFLLYYVPLSITPPASDSSAGENFQVQFFSIFDKETLSVPMFVLNHFLAKQSSKHRKNGKMHTRKRNITIR